MYVCVCCCSSLSDEKSSSSTTTTMSTTNESDSDTDTKSKPWLSRMFKNETNNQNEQSATAGGGFNAAKHFDLKNLRHDFNRPAGNAPAAGLRISKTGRKIR